MTWHQVQMIAGMCASGVFVGGNLSMLIKAWRTKDVTSYSVLSLTLNNFGNAVYWLYVVSLPMGPVYVLHSFYTVVAALMLAWALMYRHKPIERVTKTVKRLTTESHRVVANPRETMEMPRVDG